MDRSDNRARDFAELLDKLVEEYGPEELTWVEMEAFQTHMHKSANDWLRTRNRIQKAGEK